MLTNKVLLITGGTGSFGNALIEYILDNKITKQFTSQVDLSIAVL
jgi:FlaA1/EpsC-like NDP-sugar epimerase